MSGEMSCWLLKASLEQEQDGYPHLACSCFSLRREKAKQDRKIRGTCSKSEFRARRASFGARFTAWNSSTEPSQKWRRGLGAFPGCKSSHWNPEKEARQ